MRRLSLLIINLWAAVSAVAQISFSPTSDTVAFQLHTNAIFETRVFPIDHNHDGFDDVLVLQGNRIVLRQNNAGHFPLQEVVMFENSIPIYSISNFADVNGDGFWDLALIAGDSIKLLLGGEERFNVSAVMQANIQYGKLSLTDYNDDGKIDLVSSIENAIVLHKDLDTGLGQTETLYTDEKTIMRFAFEDFNTDGRLDLVIATQQDKLKILFREDDNSFTEKYSRPITHAVLIEVADINLDAFPDLVVLERTKSIFSLVYIEEEETFQEKIEMPIGFPPTYAMQVIDIGNNGTPDLVYFNSGALIIRENTGTGFSDTEQWITYDLIDAFFIHRFNANNDGIGDLLAVDPRTYVVVTLNEAGNHISHDALPVYNYYRDAITSDLDGDEFPDIAAASYNGALAVFWGAAESPYETCSGFRLPQFVEHIIAEDIDRDGHTDLVLTQASPSNMINSLLLMKGTGNRSFADPILWKMFPDPGPPVSADLNNDGINEVVVFSKFGDNLMWVEGYGDAVGDFYLTDNKLNLPGRGIFNVTPLDINNDGYSDLVTANYTDANLSMLLNSSHGDGFTETLVIPDGAPTQAVAAVGVHLNDDDYIDLVASIKNASGAYELQSFLNTEGTSFIYHKTYPLTSHFQQPSRLDAFDLDGDGDIDIVLGDYDYLLNAVLRNDNGEFVMQENVMPAHSQATRVFPDLNADGRPDLFSLTFLNGAVFTTLNNSVIEPVSPNVEIEVTEVSSHSASISLSPPGAQERLVIVSKGESLLALPSDATFYTPRAHFGEGDMLAEGSYVVFAGVGGSVDVTGLSSSTRYTISVFEYNQNIPQKTFVNYSSEHVDLTFETLNMPPTVTQVADQHSLNFQPVAFPLELEDVDDALEDLVLTFVSTDEEVLPWDSIFYLVEEGSIWIRLFPKSDGETNVTVTVTDPADNSVTTTFLLQSVIPPAIEPVADQSTMGLDELIIPLTITDLDNTLDELEFMFSSSNTSVISTDAVLYDIVDDGIVLVLKPVDIGQTEITVHVSDPAENKVSTSFVLTSLVVSIMSESDPVFDASPNPVEGRVRLDHPRRHQTMIVMDIFGRVVERFDAIPEEIDLTLQPRGIYILRTEQGETVKIIKR